jgi:hypothetical protein
MRQSDSIKFAGIKLSVEVAKLIEMCGVDVLDDLIKQRAQLRSRTELLNECLRGADSETEALWVEYVSDITSADVTIAGALCEVADGDVSFVTQRGRGPHLSDEIQSWHEETTYYQFADGSCVRIESHEAEEISTAEFHAAEDRENDRREYEMGVN